MEANKEEETTEIANDAVSRVEEQRKQDLLEKLQEFGMSPTIEHTTKLLSPIDYEISSIGSPYSDLKSPTPLLDYSTGFSIKSSEIQIRRLVEEVLESEMTYYDSLDLFLKYYVYPLLNFTTGGFSSGVPLTTLSQVVGQILLVHSSFYNQMFTKTIINSTNELVENMCEGIIQLVKNYYLYSEYCNIYQEVLELSSYQRNETKSMKSALRSLSHYLEATQPVTKRHDLSFISLIQKPITRFGKYRLFLEAIHKCIDRSVDPVAYDRTIEALEITKISLNIINDETINSKDSIDWLGLEGLTNLSSLDIPVAFFGKPRLIGSLFIIWVEQDIPRKSAFAAVLFKSHLLLVSISHTISRRTVRFVIPLSQCILGDDEKESNGGLYSTYPYSLKLIFEINQCHYEALVVCVSSQEYDIWLDHLQVLINYVNGPYDMKFSEPNKAINLVSKVPKATSACNVSLGLKDKEARKNCYYQRAIGIIIHNPQNPTSLPRSLSSWDIPGPSIDTFRARISRTERIRIEKKIGNLWSEQLPKLTTKYEHTLSHRMSMISLFGQRIEEKVAVEEEPMAAKSAKSAKPTKPATPQQIDGHDQEIETLYTAKTHQSGLVSRASTFKSSFSNFIRSVSVKKDATTVKDQESKENISPGGS